MNRNNNTALVATVAVISTIALVMVVITVLVLTNVIPLGASRTSTEVKQESSSQAETEKPTDVNKQSSSSGVDEAEILVENHEEPTTMYVANVKNSVYLRSEPIENESNIITTIPVGAQVVLLENTSTVFSKVSYSGKTGYMKRDYLSATAPKKETVSSGNTTVYKYMYVANVKNSIYLRSSAAENSSNIITTIPVGTQIGYIERANNVFSKINYNGTIGYVKSSYLADYYTQSYTYLTVCNVKNSIYLRSTPQENPSNIITTIPVGSTVRYLGNGGNGFYKISYGGYTGYSKSAYLR